MTTQSEMTNLTNEVCPRCGSEEIRHTSWGGGYSTITFGCECKECQHTFMSEYNLENGTYQESEYK